MSLDPDALLKHRLNRAYAEGYGGGYRDGWRDCLDAIAAELSGIEIPTRVPPLDSLPFPPAYNNDPR